MRADGEELRAVPHDVVERHAVSELARRPRRRRPALDAIQPVVSPPTATYVEPP
jgi:hypothetical protein